MKSDLPADPLSGTEEPAAGRPPVRLAELRGRARSMEAEQEDRDALLDELARPLEPDEDARARADLLHLIIDDPWLGGFSGSDGQRVDAVAAQALLDLGEPYASELSQEGRIALGLPEPDPTADEVDVPGTSTLATPPSSALNEQELDPNSPRSNVGLGLAVLVALVELGCTVALEKWIPLGLVIVGVTAVAPIFLPRSSDGGMEFLRRASLVLMGLMAIPWAATAVLTFMFLGPYGVIPLAMAAGRLTAMFCLSRPAQDRALEPTPEP